jgi:hypothetical protein
MNCADEASSMDKETLLLNELPADMLEDSERGFGG